MLIQAPWFVYELPRTNSLYNSEVVDPCFEGATYTVGGLSIEADVEFIASHRNRDYGCVTRGHFGGFPEFDVIELTIVTKEAGLYHELPIPASEGQSAWLLMSAYQANGQWYYWGSPQGTPCRDTTDIVPQLTQICDQIAAKLKPQKPA